MLVDQVRQLVAYAALLVRFDEVEQWQMLRLVVVDELCEGFIRLDDDAVLNKRDRNAHVAKQRFLLRFQQACRSLSLVQRATCSGKRDFPRDDECHLLGVVRAQPVSRVVFTQRLH